MTNNQIMQTISALTERLNDLGKKLDDQTVIGLARITPYTVTKTAYIDDTEITFTDVPAGNLTVYTDKVIDYQINKQGSIITISFDPLEEITKITLSILKEE